MRVDQLMPLLSSPRRPEHFLESSSIFLEINMQTIHPL